MINGVGFLFETMEAPVEYYEGGLDEGRFNQNKACFTLCIVPRSSLLLFLRTRENEDNATIITSILLRMMMADWGSLV